MWRFNKKGQSVFEYAIILGVVGVALMAMQVYLRRGIQSGIRIAADELGEQDVFFRDREVSVTEEGAIPKLGFLGSASSSNVVSSTDSTTNLRLGNDAQTQGGNYELEVTQTSSNRAVGGSDQPSSVTFSGWYED
ncbi:MAG: hypothetical protein JW714_01090 [Candidatus Omnitrophica bacterium]|nr:hypothetical protein [Candidatus Omnitrophota bacterium]